MKINVVTATFSPVLRLAQNGLAETHSPDMLPRFPIWEILMKFNSRIIGRRESSFVSDVFAIMAVDLVVLSEKN